MSLEPFLVATGPCGLPRPVPILAASGAENLGPLAPAAVARAHWLLRSLTIRYSYAVDGWGSWSEEFTCSVDGQPLQRLLQSPSFSRTAVDTAAGRSSSFFFSPALAHANGAGQYFFQFQLADGSYPDQEVLLATELLAGHRLLASATASFLGIPLALYLQVPSQSSFSSGSIGTFAIAAGSWQDQDP
ncbi:MAG: hypothetical protein LBT98_02260 [Puniceicoccales bacterium]|jgi:hypothetical protein|nr:hypothetical protein [Puniceicoccales bacterium]